MLRHNGWVVPMPLPLTPHSAPAARPTHLGSHGVAELGNRVGEVEGLQGTGQHKARVGQPGAPSKPGCPLSPIMQHTVHAQPRPAQQRTLSVRMRPVSAASGRSSWKSCGSRAEMGGEVAA